MRVLFAEDLESNRDVTEKYFTLCTDWHVVFAECGEDALWQFHAARENGVPFDVIVLDIAMPDMSGLKVAQLIRECDESVPIVFYTAYDIALNRHGAEDVKAAAFISKTVVTDDLKAAIEKAVAR